MTASTCLACRSLAIRTSTLIVGPLVLVVLPILPSTPPLFSRHAPAGLARDPKLIAYLLCRVRPRGRFARSPVDPPVPSETDRTTSTVALPPHQGPSVEWRAEQGTSKRFPGCAPSGGPLQSISLRTRL